MTPAAARVLAEALDQVEDAPTDGWEHYATSMTDRGGVFYYDHAAAGWRLRVDTTTAGQHAVFEQDHDHHEAKAEEDASWEA